ncbi:hypothetical protein [Actinoplanes subglobosus]|uniref:Lipoprotein n=1 Tax=Actinoplanes subglobosus TaxID=1547892 RepID=A0ABV8J8Y0_9ACTN
MHARVTTTVAVLLTVIAGGCARAEVEPAGPGPVAPEVHARWESCPPAGDPNESTLEAYGLPVLDDAFQPVAAVVCRVELRERAGGGTETIAEELRAEDVGALVTALRLPDEAATAQACTEEFHLVPWLALLDREGRWVRPGVPIDSCRKPRIEFRTALGELTTTTVSSRIVEQPGR